MKVLFPISLGILCFLTLGGEGKTKGMKEKEPHAYLENDETTRLDALESRVQELEYMVKKMRDCDGFFYEGSCFFLLDQKMVGRNKAVEKCNKKGGKLAIVDSERLYSGLRNYLLGLKLEFSYMPDYELSVWIDGEYKNGTVTCSSGYDMNWNILWYANYPNIDTPEHMYMAFKVSAQITMKQHMINVDGGYHYYSLCEK